MKDPSDASPVLDLIRSSESSSVVDGAFRAMAMLRLVPDDESVNEILCYVERLPVDDGMHFWVAGRISWMAHAGSQLVLNHMRELRPRRSDGSCVSVS